MVAVPSIAAWLPALEPVAAAVRSISGATTLVAGYPRLEERIEQGRAGFLESDVGRMRHRDRRENKGDGAPAEHVAKSDFHDWRLLFLSVQRPMLSRFTPVVSMRNIQVTIAPNTELMTRL